MASNLLSLLSDCGILERSARRAHNYLRVSPRFLAYAEGTAGRHRLHGLPTGQTAVLEYAIASWDEFHGDALRAARFLEEFLNERDQAGGLRAVFPSLEQFGLRAAA